MIVVGKMDSEEGGRERERKREREREMLHGHNILLQAVSALLCV